MDKTPAKQRLLLPDIARGVSLLASPQPTRSKPGHHRHLQRGAQETPSAASTPRAGGRLLRRVLRNVRSRARPADVFHAAGFGFGLVVASLYRKHYPLRDARRVLLRRYGTLAALGLIHMLALFYGDIMLTYGLIGVLMALLFTVSAKWLRLIAYILLDSFRRYRHRRRFCCVLLRARGPARYARPHHGAVNRG
ncbi:DUF418 domain-containing protein [Corynebacterium mycetoides]|uniref:hypothetical protein n=1 Tax=Corynebacterium mycetoides TaxID=38302 RepID=UPI0012FC406F|nr:hypothetical protein [Corynebacterium mycetoides]